MQELLERFPRQRDDVAARVIGGEAVVVTPADSQVHELDPVATFVWTRCDGTHSGWALVDEIVREFDVTRERAAQDLGELLVVLESKKLVVLNERPGS